MDPVSTLATLVGLICNWKAERGAAAADKFQDFLTYLTDHHFEVLRSDIAQSHDLQVQLRGLLTLNLEHISQRLDLVSAGIAALASKIEGLAPVASALKIPQDQLSEQATQILKVFDQTESEFMMPEPGSSDTFIFMPSQMMISFSEKRFLSADFDSLVNLGLFQEEYFASGIKTHKITRLGARLASQMPKQNVGGVE